MLHCYAFFAQTLQARKERGSLDIYNAQSTITVGLEQNLQVMGSQAWFKVHITYHLTFEDWEVEKKKLYGIGRQNS